MRFCAQRARFSPSKVSISSLTVPCAFPLTDGAPLHRPRRLRKDVTIKTCLLRPARPSFTFTRNCLPVPVLRMARRVRHLPTMPREAFVYPIIFTCNCLSPNPVPVLKTGMTGRRLLHPAPFCSDPLSRNHELQAGFKVSICAFVNVRRQCEAS